MPFGVELLQLTISTLKAKSALIRVTSAFRRGASSAGVSKIAVNSVVDVSPVPFGVELLQLVDEKHYHGCTPIWSPVPFGVELLQLRKRAGGTNGTSR